MAKAQSTVAWPRNWPRQNKAYFYDLACALALESRLDPTAADIARAALAALRKAVEAGFDNRYELEPTRTSPHSVRMTVPVSSSCVADAEAV